MSQDCFYCDLKRKHNLDSNGLCLMHSFQQPNPTPRDQNPQQSSLSRILSLLQDIDKELTSFPPNNKDTHYCTALSPLLTDIRQQINNIQALISQPPQKQYNLIEMITEPHPVESKEKSESGENEIKAYLGIRDFQTQTQGNWYQNWGRLIKMVFFYMENCSDNSFFLQKINQDLQFLQMCSKMQTQEESRSKKNQDEQACTGIEESTAIYDRSVVMTNDLQRMMLLQALQMQKLLQRKEQIYFLNE